MSKLRTLSLTGTVLTVNCSVLGPSLEHLYVPSLNSKCKSYFKAHNSSDGRADNLLECMLEKCGRNHKPWKAPPERPRLIIHGDPDALGLYWLCVVLGVLTGVSPWLDWRKRERFAAVVAALGERCAYEGDAPEAQAV